MRYYPRMPLVAALLIFPLFALMAGESAQLRESRDQAARGDASAMNELGVAYYSGTDGVGQDYREAVNWFKKAANAGNVQAMNNLGIVHRDGIGVGENPAEAFAWFEKAAKRGHVWAQFSTGKAYFDGAGVAKDLIEAEQWFGKAAEKDNANSVRMLGIIEYTRYQNSGNEGQARRAATWMRQAAGMGDVTAQYNLGVFYADGLGVPQDEAEAVRWYTRAATDGDSLAMLALGRCYLTGTGVDQDYAKARRWLTAALENGEEEAEEDLAGIPAKAGDKPATGSGTGKTAGALAGKWLGKAWGGRADTLFDFDLELRETAGGYGGEVVMQGTTARIEKAALDGAGVATVEARADAGGAEGLTLGIRGALTGDDWSGEITATAPGGGSVPPITFVARRGGGRAGPAEGESANLWQAKRLAAAGNAEAMTTLGTYYFRGAEGLAKDPAQALDWFRKAAAAGDAEAAYNLGSCYKGGVGVEENSAEAYRWFVRAAELGMAAGQEEVGFAHMVGNGVAKDLDAAEKWFSQAAGTGSANAALQMGNVLTLRMDEKGVTPEETAKAIRWFSQAADGGEVSAMFNIAVFYNNGKGVPKDFAEAGRWYERAARHGDAGAQYRLGVYFFEGKGRERDLGKAKRWLTEAQKNGDKRAAEAIAQIPADVEATGDQPIPVETGKILQDFADNPKAAATKYRDVMIDVIPPKGGSNIDYAKGVLTLGLKGQPLTLRFRMASQAGGRTIAIGQPIRGFCLGLEDGVIKVDSARFITMEDIKKVEVPTPAPAAPTLDGVWEGSYTDMGGGDRYRLRIDGTVAELSDEGLGLEVVEAYIKDGLATVRAGWSDDEGVRREAFFTGPLAGDQWAGTVVVISGASVLFQGPFNLARNAR